MNEHLLSDLETQWISEHDVGNVSEDISEGWKKHCGRTHLVSLEPCIKGKA